MFQTISWGQYISVIALLLFFYYSYVAYRYYKWEVLAVFGIVKIDEPAIKVPLEEIRLSLVTENHEDYLPQSDVGASVQLIQDEIKAYLVTTSGTAISKEDMLDALKAIVAKYPIENLSGQNNVLHQFILTEVGVIHPGVIKSEDIVEVLV